MKPSAQRIRRFEAALHRNEKAILTSSDARAGKIVRILQAKYLGHRNGYQPGGAKYNPTLWRKVTSPGSRRVVRPRPRGSR